MMARWRDQIARLREVDVAHATFGAGSHRFRGRPVDTSEIVAFEEYCGFSLPEDYRSYLLEVGFGVGPYHGLLTFDRIIQELESIYESYSVQHRNRGSSGDGFGLEQEIAEALEAGKPLEFKAPSTPGGFIPFCEEGCEFLAVIVTLGRFRGRVFDTTRFAENGSHWRAAKSPPGIINSAENSASDASMPSLPSFTEWAEAWIRCCRRDLGVA